MSKAALMSSASETLTAAVAEPALQNQRKAHGPRRVKLQESLPDAWWTSHEVCAYLNTDPATLWRIRQNDPTFPEAAQFEKRSLRWLRSEVMAWSQSKRKKKTAENSQSAAEAEPGCAAQALNRTPWSKSSDWG